jgi:O-antigen ligase
MQARRPQLAELGLFLLVVALPLVFTPFSASPFGDPKLVVLVAASACLLAAGLPADRLTTYAGALLVLVALTAAVLGVDPPKGLTADPSSAGNGLIPIACIAVVASLGAALPTELRRRTMRWFVSAGVAVSGIGILFRLMPGAFETIFPGQGMIGSTLGNPVFAVAFVAAALAALLTIDPGSSGGSWWTKLAVMTVGVASFDQRSSIVFLLAVGVVALWRRPDARIRIGKALAVVVLLTLAWQAVAPLLPVPARLAAQFSTLSGERARLVTWKVGLMGTADRPLLGWGPGTTQSAYLATASPEDVEITGRGFKDAHNLFVGTSVEMGLLGLVAMTVLLGSLVTRALPRSAERAPAAAAAAVLLLSAMIEPTNLVLSPLLYLFLAMGGPVSDDLVGAPQGRAWRTARVLTIVALSGALVVSVQMLAASTFERWGRVYGEQWALRRAIALQPWRTTSREHLALQRALDGRAGDEAASEEAVAVIADAVRRAPWDVNVRVWAADVHTLVNDPDGAAAWLAEQIERFPADASVNDDIPPTDGFHEPGDPSENA